MNKLPQVKVLTASWVLYDLANTVFSATITFIFAKHMGAASTGVVNSLAMVAAGVATPLFASLADRTGRAGGYNSVATLICIGAMAVFGLTTSTPMLLTAFFVATLFYQAALVFYNSLLPSVAGEGQMGLISGLGVGLGYLGTVFTLAIALPVETRLGVSWAYFLTAATFLVCALPCMLLVRDRRPIEKERMTRSLVADQWWEVVNTVRNLPRQPALMWFLLANFFAVDVLNTAILFYGRFIQDCFEPLASSGNLTLLGHSYTLSGFIIIGGLAVNVPALGYGLILGHWADRYGAVRMFILSIGCLSGGLAGAALFGGWAPMMFLISICFFGGLGLAGIWTVGRKLLIQLVPRELVGRYFGLYGITNKVSVVGSTVCGVMISLYGPRIAFLSQVLPLLIAFFCMYMMARHWKRAQQAMPLHKQRPMRYSRKTGQKIGLN